MHPVSCTAIVRNKFTDRSIGGRMNRIRDSCETEKKFAMKSTIEIDLGDMHPWKEFEDCDR